MDEREIRGSRRPDGRQRPEYRQESADSSMNRRSSSNRRKGKRVSRRRRRQRMFMKLVILFVLIIAIIGTVLFWIKYGPTKKTYDLNKYFGITSEEQMGLTINNEVMETHAKLYDGQVYVPYETVKAQLNQRFYWDKNEHILLYTLPDGMVNAKAGNKEYTIIKKPQSEKYEIFKEEDETAYIALDFVKKYTALDYRTYENPGRVTIDTDSKVTISEVKSNTQVRLRGGVKSPVLAQIEKGDTVQIIDQVEQWKKVRTEDGVIGYTKESRLKKEVKKQIDREFKEEEFKSIHKDEMINLAWHQVTGMAGNNTVVDALANTKGLNVLSPTWFSAKDNEGNIKSLASSDYVNYAHEAGMDVWALVDNFSEKVDSKELLSHTTARNNMVEQLIKESLNAGVDGINVDFENIPVSAGDDYIQFIRELSVECRKNDLVLSVDNYVPKGFNAHYNLKEQGIMADYVIIMGYDEHYSGSLEAGSVASYNYVKEGIEQALKDVPKEKLINAVPFYTRLWKEVPKTESELKAQEGTEEGSYLTKVSSESMGMLVGEKKVNDAGAAITWDDNTKQNYAEWEADGVTYKIWLEDEKSLEEKLQLMKDFKLAGTAAWKLGFESPEIWDMIQKYVE